MERKALGVLHAQLRNDYKHVKTSSEVWLDARSALARAQQANGVVTERGGYVARKRERPRRELLPYLLDNSNITCVTMG